MTENTSTPYIVEKFFQYYEDNDVSNMKDRNKRDKIDKFSHMLYDLSQKYPEHFPIEILSELKKDFKSCTGVELFGEIIRMYHESLYTDHAETFAKEKKIPYNVFGSNSEDKIMWKRDLQRLHPEYKDIIIHDFEREKCAYHVFRKDYLIICNYSYNL